MLCGITKLDVKARGGVTKPEATAGCDVTEPELFNEILVLLSQRRLGVV